MKPLVTVIIPVYNVEKYLHCCVKSVLAQSYTNLEIILVDDGSTDDCAKICDVYANADSRVKVVHQKNSGLSAARNTALQQCKGTYLTFVDGDDHIHPHYIEYLLRMLLDNEADISVCAWRKVHAESFLEPEIQAEEQWVFTREAALVDMLYQQHFDTTACCKLYKKSLFQNLFYPEKYLYEDLATTYKLLLRAEKICGTNKQLYYYVQRKESIENCGFNQKKLQIVDILREMEDYISIHAVYAKKAFASRALSANFHVLACIQKISENKQATNILWSEIKKLRYGVLHDKTARKKARLAAAVSYMGLYATKQILKVVSR